MFYKQETIAIVIDGATTHHAAKSIGLRIDWKRFREAFMQRGRLLKISYVIAEFQDEDGFAGVRCVLDWMDYNGFSVISRQAQSIDNGDGEPKRKVPNMAVAFTLEAMRVADRADHVLLFTADGSYCPLIQEMQRSCRVTVCSVRGAASDHLRRVADTFVEMETLRAEIEKDAAEAR